jgi:hypothetical protein
VDLVVPDTTPEDLPEVAADLEALDLTVDPAPGVLATLVAEDADDLAALALADEDLVAEDLVAAPLLDLVIEALLVPAVLDIEPMPLLEVDPVVAILGL